MLEGGGGVGEGGLSKLSAPAKGWGGGREVGAVEAKSTQWNEKLLPA